MKGFGRCTQNYRKIQFKIIEKSFFCNFIIKFSCDFEPFRATHRKTKLFFVFLDVSI